MNKLLHWNRRTHLYLALLLLPWFLMYGVSSIPFSHGTFFEERDRASGKPLWIQREVREGYEIPLDDLKVVGERVVKDTGLRGAFGAYRQSATQINVYVYTFWNSTQVKYFTAEKRLIVEDRRFRWDHFLTGMHAKGGFESGGLHDLWAVFVDLSVVGMLLWVVTGLVMWWKLPSTHRWGWIALASGCASFAYFIWKL